MATEFHKTDGMLVRSRDTHGEEILHPDGQWRPYPDFKPFEATKISRADAAEMCPPDKLDAPGTVDTPRAPVRP